MPAKKDIPNTLITAAMKLAAEKSWHDVTMIDIAQTAGLSVAECYDHCRSKGDILRKFIYKIDREVLADLEDEDFDEPGHDRLIAVMMARFDALAAYRPALRSITDVHGDLGPADQLRAIKTHFGSMRWMLDAAGFRTGGLHGSLRIAGLTGIYARCFKYWLDDTSTDFGPTMARLDRELSKASVWDARVEKGLGKANKLCDRISKKYHRFAAKKSAPSDQTNSTQSPETGDNAPASSS
ncbi:TetR/AcrR family transcriptional regulator [Thalassospira lucentensis]|uniref:TetR/AcrR family transcriptional regulator n=1 Tax=Thalassospira lucentensis TaxID=168935 RepID=UPI00142DFAC8|nr:TetR/AcrR family transcriptional regulator [Thalassospira lucentensis]NIZ00082.1 helix-turn-helix transcriptional regulator [Thalassospira lucentensis]